MTYVLDASVALCWVIPRPLTPAALRLRDQCQKRVRELIAPSHFPGEIANGLTKAERQKLIYLGEARRLILDVLSTPPVLHSSTPLYYRAIDISSRTRSGFYDCLYVALAEREQCELVTADDKLLRNLQPHFPFVVALASLP
ncbi:MAG TPA: type II toxin-antitoxin system VapC family toxin [Acetobacteraceae bacterium]|nr:type II toxin-antitoxin system VapC family toxin [Acetobacteraceae bacterium]